MAFQPLAGMDEQRFGPTNMDINASEKIWEFVSPHRRTP